MIYRQLASLSRISFSSTEPFKSVASFSDFKIKVLVLGQEVMEATLPEG